MDKDGGCDHDGWSKSTVYEDGGVSVEICNMCGMRFVGILDNDLHWRLVPVNDILHAIELRDAILPIVGVNCSEGGD